MTKTVGIFQTSQRAGVGGSPVLVGDYRISLPSSGIEIVRQPAQPRALWERTKVNTGGVPPLQEAI